MVAIASSYLHGDMTAYGSSNIKLQSNKTRISEAADLIIFDEVGSQVAR